MNQVIEAIEKRSSTRGYTDEPLSDAQLDALIQAGLQAPTAANKQALHRRSKNRRKNILRCKK